MAGIQSTPINLALNFCYRHCFASKVRSFIANRVSCKHAAIISRSIIANRIILCTTIFIYYLLFCAYYFQNCIIQNNVHDLPLGFNFKLNAANGKLSAIPYSNCYQVRYYGLDPQTRPKHFLTINKIIL